MLILGKLPVPSFDVASGISMRRQWFTFVRLPNPYMAGLIPPFSVSFTTTPSPDQQHTAV
jgi:hypothetical protein